MPDTHLPPSFDAEIATALAALDRIRSAVGNLRHTSAYRGLLKNADTAEQALKALQESLEMGVSEATHAVVDFGGPDATVHAILPNKEEVPPYTKEAAIQLADSLHDISGGNAGRREAIRLQLKTLAAFGWPEDVCSRIRNDWCRAGGYFDAPPLKASSHGHH
jgi:hypothetical protein